MEIVPSSLRILILGGYGTFGSRLVRLLADEFALTLLVSGRSRIKAEAFCRSVEGKATLVPTVFDRNQPALSQLEALSPDIVVDASGPFQAYGEAPYRVAEAAIRLGICYLDLADGADFVAGISRFDAAARVSNVFILSGVSTCPAVTAAASRYLAIGMSSVESITGGIAPSPHVRIGRSVIAAIASYAGKAVALVRDGKPSTGHAMTETRRRTIAPPGILPLHSRLFTLVEVPDLTVLPRLWPALKTVWFGVATRPESLLRLLIGLAFAVRWRLLPSLTPFVPLIHWANGFLRWGEHRGGMFVAVTGRDKAGKPVERSWHLIAEGEDGPFVPATPAAAIILRALAGQRPSPGARPALEEVDLENLAPLFGSKRITTGIRHDTQEGALPLYAGALGGSYQTLPPPIQALHWLEPNDSQGDKIVCGRASVERGKGLLARLVGSIIGFPPESGDIPVTVRFQVKDGVEIWHRDFGGRRFHSVQSAGRGRNAHLVDERFGPFVMGLAVSIEPGRLRITVRNWRFLGIPLPGFLAPNGNTFESAQDDRFNFHVEIAHPLLGLIVRYRGWLVPENAHKP